MAKDISREELREAKKNTKPAHLINFIDENFFRKSIVWLDCASGDGFMVADYFEKKGKMRGVWPNFYICIDKDEEKLNRLKEKGFVTHCIDLEINSVKDYVNKVAVILSIETIEHLTKNAAMKMIDDFIKILSPGGMMIISFPRVVPLDNPVNKHQPDVNEIACYADFFQSFYREEWKKSYLLIFKGKKSDVKSR